LPNNSQNQPDTDNSDRTLSTGGPGGAAAGQIGPYRLLQLLGEGGMGEVWLAEQKTPIHRTVALKLIKAGMDTKTVIARFESERQALALMDHPAIAKVFDAGATPEGRPYFVMEYVPGLPITDYCDKHRLTVKERLELFMQVCDGVQHAHQKAIIHRDLKPSNVLVGELEGKPVPKIIDFGLAKATAQRLTEKTLFTELGVMMGTPEYMSPEQADMGEQNIDTRTDVYSLAVILYQLLVGVLPFEAKAMRATGLEAILRAIREQEPAKPSTRIRSMGPASSLSAQNRREDPRTFARHIRGELDWITMKALEKERSRRYGSPAELRADIQRHLANEPVAAHPPSASYRARKYIRRHRLAVGFAASVAVLLVAFAATMAVQKVRISRERDRAEKNRAEATKQAQLALDTIYQVVTSADNRLRDVAGTGELRKELMQGAMKNLDQISRSAATANWADRTMGVALQRMGDFYAQMGMQNEEIQVENQALTIFRRLMKEQPSEQWIPWNIAVSLDKLGDIAKQQDPEPAAALDYFQQSLKIREQLAQDIHQPAPPPFRRKMALGVSATKLVDYYLQLGDPADALKYANEALRAYTEAADSPGGAKERPLYLGWAYYQIGRASLPVEGEAKARKALLQSVENRQEWVQADPLNAVAKLDLQHSFAAMGDLELQVGKPSAALEQYKKAAEMMEVLLQKDSTNEEFQWNLAQAEYGMGVALRLLGKRQEAQAHFQKCLKLRQVLLQTDPKSVQMRSEVMFVRAQLGEHETPSRTAQELRDSAPKHPGILYVAGQGYALSASAVTDDRASGRQPKQIAELQRNYVDAAVRSLGDAVANGYKDTWMLAHDPALQSVQNDDGFRKLLNGLQQ
jgi:serine/threonine protein kinase/tetratricopeptide (TPR) repeat protein